MTIRSSCDVCFAHSKWCVILLLSLVPSVSQETSAQQAIAVSSKTNRTAVADLKSEHPLDPALRMANASLQNLRENIHDYEAVFVKRCRVDGALPKLQYANVKIRNRKVQAGQTTAPFSVYLNFLAPASVKGREVIWVEGRNNGNMVAHESGLKGMINVNLDPNGYLAMRGQRHPITEIGIENLLVKLIETGSRDRQQGECDVQFFSNAKIRDTACTMLQVVHHEKKDCFDFHIARVYFDQSLNIPIRYESWSWPTTDGGQPVLEEEYTYLNVNLNVGLRDSDFDIANPAYQFR
ncbi:hypothetical protein Q31b_13580 [Novipirellula aureliae]|uniref:DUF1571 domain-containing protein n=1 Tax=Novipirellula aureliae TaxID=2527966 RepID=A0A5C6E8R3_9BACT|nr:DUF1571 domain-containing protein [Novipirellula aureliae]TWU43826.1 hypothetical protein Q31b_13580 [Novipirellula aureliae]